MGFEISKNTYLFSAAQAAKKQSNANPITISSVLAKFDKSIREFILDNVSISDGIILYGLDYISEEKNINVSLFKNALICLGDVLQMIKKEDPASFQAIKNLKKESNFRITFYMTQKDWSYYCSNKSAGEYEGHYFNNINLKGFKPDHSIYYHELIHAADDGKRLNRTTLEQYINYDYNLDADYLSSDVKFSGLAEKINLYRKKLANQWESDLKRYKNYRKNFINYNSLMAASANKALSKDEVKLCTELENNAIEDETYLQQRKYWFYDDDIFATFWGELTTQPKISFPYALTNNRELIACALTTLKYGTTEQKKMIRQDAELMEIIRQWKGCHL